MPSPDRPDGARPDPESPRSAPPPGKRHFGLSALFAMLLVAALLVEPLLMRRRPDTLSYSEFKTLVALKVVDSLVVSANQITGTIAVSGLDRALPKARADVLRRTAEGLPSLPFTVTRVDDPKLVEELQAAGIHYAGRNEPTWLPTLLSWLLPMLLIYLIWSFSLRRFNPAGRMAAVGKSQAKTYFEQNTGVTFADVAGIDEARAELVEIVDFLKNPERYRRLGGRIPKGVLLIGAPGTGKTLLAKALAGEAQVPFFSITGSDFVEMFVGVGAARVRDLFVQAQASAPSIIFIDELDALGRTRSAASIIGGHEEREQTLNQLLAEMDGFDTRKGVMLLAATNRPEVLDPALLRPGRFDRKIVLDRPDLKGREQILRVHVATVTLSPAVDLTAIAARTPGFVGADLANLVNEAALAAARAGKTAVEMIDFDNAIDRVIAGLEKKSRVITPAEKVIVAHHEAGHALVAERRRTADRVARVSIIPRGVAALGYTRQQPTEDRYLLTRSELLDRLDVMLGGRVAEELIFGDVSTGAHDDLQRATDLAREMIARYGMSEAIGLAAYDERGRQMFLDAAGGLSREYSEDTQRTIDAEIKRLLHEAHERAWATVSAERATLVRLATVLIEREVIDRPALEAILGPPPVAAVA